MICRSMFCQNELGDDVQGSRKYCDKNNKCKNKHHASIKKEELLRYREEESFKLRREFAIQCLSQLCQIETYRDMPIEEFEMMNFDLSDGIFSLTDCSDDIIEFTIDQYIIFYSVMDGWIHIYKTSNN